MKKKAELVAWCESKLGTPYVYGAKGAVLTQSQINTWAALYPATFTASYIAKAKTFIGQACTDCSGLISWLTGTLRGFPIIRIPPPRRWRSVNWMNQ